MMHDESKVKHYGGPEVLRVGDVVQYEGEKIVVKVNQSRAVVASTKAKSIRFTDSRSGKEVGFERVGADTVSISPSSAIPILRRTGEAGLNHWLQHKELPQ